MPHIKSKKHPVTAAVFMAVALPAAAQQSTPPSGQPASLPAVKVQATADGYKADTSASPKATAPLLDTPQSISVIKEQIVKEQAATTLTEALRNSPGVGTFNLGENGSTNTGDAIYLRGSDISSNIFVDGIRDLGSVSRDMFNIQQVEVLKGAAGAEIGRGAATGAVNMVSKQPRLDDSLDASIGAGSADYKRLTLDWNKQFSDTGAFRLNLMGLDSGVAGRDFIKNKRFAIAPSVAFGLNTPTKIFVDYLHVEQDNTPDGGVFTVGLPGYSSPDPTNRPFMNTAPRVSSSNYYGTTSDHDNVRADMFTVIVDHAFTPDLSIRNTTRVGRTRQDYMLSSFMGGTAQLVTPNPADPSTWTITRNINNKLANNEIVANQTNLKARFKTGPLSHSVSTGLELIREEQTSYLFGATGSAGVGSWPPVSVYSPVADVTGYTRTLTGAYNLGKTDTTGLYAFDTVTVTPHIQFTAGLRYDHYKTTYDSVAATGVATPLAKSGNMISGMFGAVYKPTSYSSVYASYATTKLPPGGANFSLAATNTTNVNNSDLNPQTAKTAELGTKWDLLNNNLSITAALYRTEYSDQILQNSDGTYYRAGNKSVQGIEIGTIGNITPNWAISAGYTTMHTKVESPTNQVVTADGSPTLAYNPTSALTLWSTYRLPFGLTVGGGARYYGKMKRGSDGAIGTPSYVEAYWVFDAMASYRVNKNLEIQFNVFNLFDKDYVASINKSGYRYTPGVPRSARITANLSF